MEVPTSLSHIFKISVRGLDQRPNKCKQQLTLCKSTECRQVRPPGTEINLRNTNVYNLFLVQTDTRYCRATLRLLKLVQIVDPLLPPVTYTRLPPLRTSSSRRQTQRDQHHHSASRLSRPSTARKCCYGPPRNPTEAVVCCVFGLFVTVSVRWLRFSQQATQLCRLARLPNSPREGRALGMGVPKIHV